MTLADMVAQYRAQNSGGYGGGQPAPMHVAPQTNTQQRPTPVQPIQQQMPPAHGNEQAGLSGMYQQFGPSYGYGLRPNWF